MLVQYLSYALIIVVIFTAYMAVMHIFRSDRLRQRVQSVADDAHLMQEESAPPLLAVFCENILTLIGVNTQQKELTLMLQQAGLNAPHAAVYFLFFKRIVQPVILVIGLILLGKTFLSHDESTLHKGMLLIIYSLITVIGAYGANLYVDNCRQKRQKILLRSFPDMLDLLLICIESGLGLDAAMARVCAELKRSHPVAASELERTRFELTMLADRVQALQNLGDRAGIVPFKSLTSSLIQTERFGTSLVDTLRVLSEDQRINRLLNAENKAARIPVMITVPLICCILPSFMLIIMGPPIIRIMEQGGIFGEATPK